MLLALPFGPGAVPVSLIGTRSDGIAFRTVTDFAFAASLGVSDRLTILLPGFGESWIY